MALVVGRAVPRMSSSRPGPTGSQAQKRRGGQLFRRRVDVSVNRRLFEAVRGRGIRQPPRDLLIRQLDLVQQRGRGCRRGEWFEQSDVA